MILEDGSSKEPKKGKKIKILLLKEVEEFEISPTEHTFDQFQRFLK